MPETTDLTAGGTSYSNCNLNYAIYPLFPGTFSQRSYVEEEIRGKERRPPPEVSVANKRSQVEPLVGKASKPVRTIFSVFSCLGCTSDGDVKRFVGGVMIWGQG